MNHCARRAPVQNIGLGLGLGLGLGIGLGLGLGLGSMACNTAPAARSSTAQHRTECSAEAAPHNTAPHARGRTELHLGVG